MAGMTSGTCQSHRSVRRTPTVSAAAQRVTTTQPRAVSEAPSAEPIKPLLSSRSRETPASVAACTTTMAAATASHTSDARSISRCARNAPASMTPRSSGRAETRTKINPPRQVAPASVAAKCPATSAAAVGFPGVSAVSA